jgi:molecular chaperone DnaK
VKVGIDLGSSYSLVARIGPDGTAVLLPDYSEQDLFHTPSQVYIAGERVYIGRSVDMLLEQRPDLDTQVIRFFKRKLGQTEPLFIDAKGNSWYPEAISALVLRKLKLDAESASGLKLESAIFTVPAHFNDLQREAVLNAAMLADIVPLGIVDEPIAAALHYGISRAKRDRTLLAYDFGGGTFDATVLTLDEKGLYVLSKSGETNLGGRDLDEQIARMIIEQFSTALGKSFQSSPRIMIEALRVAEEVKIELCMPGRKFVKRTILLGGEAVQFVLTREEFDLAIGAFVDRTIDLTVQCVKECGLSLTSIDTVLLVGGSSLVPQVATRIRKLFGGDGQEILYHEPSKAVALGAAIYSARVGGQVTAYELPLEMRGVSGYNVGLRIVDPQSGRTSVDILMKKNSPLPSLVKKKYYTARADQSRIVLELVQYRERDQLTSLGKLIVGPLLSPRLNYPVEVTVENKEDGTVSIQAYDSETGAELSQIFSRGGPSSIGRLASQRALVRSAVISSVY